MDQKTEQLFDDNHDLIIDRAIKCFGLIRDSVKRLGSFESAVYEVSHAGKSFILRATDSTHRSAEQIMAELHWVGFLADKNIPVCRAVESQFGNLVESFEIPDDGEVSISLILFEKAEGARLAPEDCDADLQRNWGEIIGKMHSLHKSYQPLSTRRHHWHEDIDIIPPEGLNKSQPLVVEKILSLREKLRGFLTTDQTYGLVHSDMHHGNFFVSNGNLNIFDTDDCHYDWFLNDLVMPLYYTFNDEKIGNRSSVFAAEFWKNLVEGYNRHFEIDNSMLGFLGDFLKFREYILYMIIFKEDIAESDPWCKRFMEGRKERIEQDIPVIDLDFSKI